MTEKKSEVSINTGHASCAVSYATNNQPWFGTSRNYRRTPIFTPFSTAQNWHKIAHL
jgi:hypothetical protein